MMAGWTDGFPNSIGQESLSDILFGNLPPLDQSLVEICDTPISGTGAAHIPGVLKDEEIQNDITPPMIATLHQLISRKSLVYANGKIMILNEVFHIFLI